jgi:hypothetical protein
VTTLRTPHELPPNVTSSFAVERRGLAAQSRVGILRFAARCGPRRRGGPHRYGDPDAEGPETWRVVEPSGSLGKRDWFAGRYSSRGCRAVRSHADPAGPEGDSYMMVRKRDGLGQAPVRGGVNLTSETPTSGIPLQGSVLYLFEVMITAHCLTKPFGAMTAVDKLTFEVLPGVVTGFSSPHSSGWSTTMRFITDLDAAKLGSALTGGQPFTSFLLPRLSNHPPTPYAPTPRHREPTVRLGRPAHLRPRLRGRRACAL